jgi:hypothetical protein
MGPQAEFLTAEINGIGSITNHGPQFFKIACGSKQLAAGGLYYCIRGQVHDCLFSEYSGGPVRFVI